MSFPIRCAIRCALRAALFAFAAFALAGWSSEAHAQFGGGGFGRQGVGGISMDAEGVVKNIEVDRLHDLRDVRARALKQMPGDLVPPNELRKISLRQLEAAVIAARKGGLVPHEMRLLAGLQRIQYVFVYPEQNDIILCGFGEGWRVDELGNIVGITSGRPVMLLDDLLVALRSARSASRGGITCSIDPTPQGMQRLQAYVKTLGGIGDDPAATLRSIEQQLGPQVITLHGVPTSSHFAQVMVAADYRMKRIAMKFDPSPVKGLPSYLDMISGGGRGASNMQPRWWLATNYNPLLTDEDGLAWEIRNLGVKAMTEDAYFSANGQRVVQAGKTSAIAQKWADLMTSKYGELSMKDPIFGELSNCMDLAVISALIFKENLLGKAGCDLAGLLSDTELPAEEFPVPKHIDTMASTVHKSGGWVISASGGVEINSWGVADKKEKSTSLTSPRAKGAPAKISHWWWN
jgi:hypothetical protein